MEKSERRLTILYHHRTRSRDGQSVHIDEMIHALRELGHTVVVVEPQRVEATKTPIESKVLPGRIYELLEFGYSALEFVKLIGAAIKHKPDALYERANLFMLSGVWASKLLGLPYLLEVNAPLAYERTQYGKLVWKRLGAWTERTCWRKADFVLPVTDVLADEIRKAGVPNSRIAVTANGVDQRVFYRRDRIAAKERLGLQGRSVLGFVGYVRDWHGLDTVINIMARNQQMQDVHLLIVGDGPARTKLEEQARALGISQRITFTGVVKRDDLPDLLAAFDIALQPQVTSYASPLKLFEYMAQGCAIIAPATPNICEVLQHGVDAELYRPESERDFEHALVALASDPQRRIALGDAALKKIADNQLTWQGNALKVTNLIYGLQRDKYPGRS